VEFPEEKKLEYVKKYIEFCLKLGQHLSLVGMAIEITKSEAEGNGNLEEIAANLIDIVQDLSGLLEDFGQGTLAMAQLFQVKPPNILKDVVESGNMDIEVKKAIVEHLIPTLIDLVENGQLEEGPGLLDIQDRDKMVEDLKDIINNYNNSDFESVLSRIEGGDSSVFDELLKEINQKEQ
jgi:hypothetical protein